MINEYYNSFLLLYDINKIIIIHFLKLYYISIY